MSDDRIESDHLPYEPRVEGAGIRVAGEAVGLVFEAGGVLAFGCAEVGIGLR